jgi:hypothetical protein
MVNSKTSLREKSPVLKGSFVVISTVEILIKQQFVKYFLDAMDKLACIASSLEFTRCVGENCSDEYLDLGKTIMRYMLDEKRAIPGDKVCR